MSDTGALRRPPISYLRPEGRVHVRGTAASIDTEGLLEYTVRMTPMTRKLIERVANWPEEDLAELEEAAREIEARRSGVYVLSDEEWTDLQEGMAEANRGEFVPDNVVAEADKRHCS